MKQEQFLTFYTKEEAEDLFKKYIKDEPLGEEEVSLDQALGRIISRDIVSPIDVPYFHRSNVDGFALKASDTYDADEESPITLKLNNEEITTGMVPKLIVKPGTATYIATGAVIPRGATAVAMVEWTEIKDDDVLIYRSVAPGENIAYAGSDIMAGEIVLRKGQVLTSRETGLIAAVGLDKVYCYRKPKIAIISTGDEVISPGDKIKEGLVYDSNGRIIADIVRENYCEPYYMGICRDNEDELIKRLEKALEMDMIILSGGTSKGVGDFTYRIIDRLGKPGIVVHGVRIKPGKQLCLAVLKNKPVAVLPGFTTSAVITFNEFIKPIIRNMAGAFREKKKTLFAKTAIKIHSYGGRREYMLVNLVHNKGEIWAYPIDKDSGSTSALAYGDGYIQIEENQEMIEKGKKVKINLLSENYQLADLIIIGSHCVGIDMLISILKEYGISSKIISVGSTAGLMAASRGEADISGIHLFDEKSGIYNIPIVKSFHELALIRGYIRKQGILFRKGDPFSGNETLEEIVRRTIEESEISMINRNKTSGTRIFFDKMLKEIFNKNGWEFKNVYEMIPGYDMEAKTHNGVASSIGFNKADWGIGIENVAKEYDLGFIFLGNEHYDFVIPKNKLEYKPIKTFLEILRSKIINSKLKKIGFIVPDNIGEILVE